MEVINNYIDSLYKNDNSQEVLELKEELKEHLIMSANEFINEGYEEQDACEMAIKKFDGGSEMLKELYFTLKENKKEIKETNKVAKIITRISGVMFIICLITSTILTYHKTVNYIYDKPFIYWQQVNSNISKIDGVVLISSYPSDSYLKEVNMNVLSIWGSKDGVINFQSLIDAKQKLPNKTTYTEIEGANHSQFGDYGTYKSDEQALINADAQKQKTADSILQFLGNIN